MSAGAVSDFRDAILGALRAAVTEFPWRIHRTADVQPAAPVVFIDSPTLSSRASGLVSVSMPVVVIVDGAVVAQVEALDEYLARLWGPLSAVGNVLDSRPAVLDVGGPSLRAQIINIETDVTAASLCPPSLAGLSH